MALPVFLSYPKTFHTDQDALLSGIMNQLRDKDIEPRTLGINEYDKDVPLSAIRRMLFESNGVLTIGFRRYLISEGAVKPGSTAEVALTKQWFTSPWPHMETAMGYQLGLPILALREVGVHSDGVLERGTVDLYIPEVDTACAAEFLESKQWRQLLNDWEHDVRTVARNRGMPPKLY